MKLSPLYISVQATDGEVRQKLLCNRFAGDVLDKIKRLCDGGIELHTQVVLCKGLNDGKVLEKTLEDLHGFYPQIKTLAIVPVGLTKFRDGLYPLEQFDEQSAKEVIDLVEGYSKGFMRSFNEPFVYLSDEFYCLAKRDFPDYAFYGDFSQIENGVGMSRKLIDEFNEAKTVKKRFSAKKTALVTGELFYPYLKELLDSVSCEHEIVAVENGFFGKSVTVAGLLTAVDILKALEGKNFDRVILPINVLKEGGELFLDGMDLKTFKRKVKAKVVLSPNDGFSLYGLL